jgi:hypothetical protein
VCHTYVSAALQVCHTYVSAAFKVWHTSWNSATLFCALLYPLARPCVPHLRLRGFQSVAHLMEQCHAFLCSFVSFSQTRCVTLMSARLSKCGTPHRTVPRFFVSFVSFSQTRCVTLMSARLSKCGTPHRTVPRFFVLFCIL